MLSILPECQKPHWVSDRLSYYLLPNKEVVTGQLVILAVALLCYCDNYDGQGQAQMATVCLLLCPCSYSNLCSMILVIIIE